MFSRLFSSSKQFPIPADTKGTDDSSVQPQPGGGPRAASPTVTEPASIAASAAPGSPMRLGGARTPSPIPGNNVDLNSLRALIKSCPSKTVYSYTLAQLEHVTPADLTALSSFFQALTPPARLHCVRCHKWFYEVENDDRSCTMPHDDESAEVEHVGYGSSRGGAYETRWDCCGRTVEGSGDLGPPSGWCYEGKHTVDRKRARYRNDSTPSNDLLESCEKKKCHRKSEASPVNPCSAVADDARSIRSQTTNSPKKRGRKRKSQAADEEDNASIITDAVSVKGPESPKRKRRKTVNANRPT